RGAARHDVPPGQRLPGHRRRVAAPAPRDRPVPRGRPLRDLRRVRVVGDDAGRGRPQRDVQRRRRVAPPVVARRGRRHGRRRHGRPGASDPGGSTFGAYGGLTCVLAESLTRDAVFEAIRQRRCYGVTAAQRIHVELSIDGLPMGAEGRRNGPVAIRGRVVGTGPVERVDVFRGLDIIHTALPYTAASFAGSRRYRVAWAGSRVRGRDRLTTWDGHLELSAGRIAGAVAFAMENPEKGI